ncbi:MAG: SDR family oxidoreductase [Flavipsychrobacter sp.]|nr:SDR family oxidoreductase [Flavipsychrobacter sp.]
MRVFVTGATGFVGSAVVKELISAGHQVLGLARSEASAKGLVEAGAEVHMGHLEDLDSLRTGVATTDGVIHTGFIHDFTKFKENCEIDRRAIAAMGAELEGSDRPFIITSGIGVLTPGIFTTEKDVPNTSGFNPRVASEEAADAVAAKGVRVSIVRLPPTVHGVGDHGFVPMLIGIAREKGSSVYQGEGGNRWPAVHRLDAASLFRLALEKSAPGGTRYHAVAEEGVAFRDIAEAIGKGLNIPVVSKSSEEAAAHFGWFAHFAALDCPSSSKQTQEILGWHPVQHGLILDLTGDSYFTV